MLAEYRKAIAAAITSVVALIALFVPAVEEYADGETIAAVSALLGTALVYMVPNAIRKGD